MQRCQCIYYLPGHYVQAVVVRVPYGTEHQTCKSEKLNSQVWSSRYPTLVSAIHAEMPSNLLGNFVWDLVSPLSEEPEHLGWT